MKNLLSRLVIVAAVVAAGVWLVGRATEPAAETSSRLAALGALAPGRPLGGSAGASASSAAVPEQFSAGFSEVALAAVPEGPDDANGLYARWLRGEVDLYANEGILPAAEIAEMQERSLSLPPSPIAANSVPQGTGGGPSPNAPAPAAPIPGVSFAAINYNSSGGSVPPDPHLAAGPNHLIAVVNSVFAIYNKNGGQLRAPTSFDTFMSSNANCTFTFDPTVVYDESADRFIMAVDADGTYFCLAVTTTANPMGTWRVYAIPTAAGNDFFDYPHIGIGHEFLFMGANIFNPNFKEARLWAIDKSDLYAGRAADVANKPLPDTEDTPQPLHYHGWQQGTWPTSTTHYFFTETDYNGETYSVWSWANPLSGSSPAKVGTVDLESATGVAAGMPLNAPQLGSSNRIQGNDYRPHDFEYRDGFAWTAQTIACNPGGGAVNCLRWAKINPVTAAVVESGVYASSGAYRSFGNLAVNQCGDMMIGYTKTSGSMYPSVFAAGRESTDPAGTLGAEVSLWPGTATYSAFDGSPYRWGDYTSMTIDPDGRRFWYIGQFSQNNGTNNARWATSISALTFGNCDDGGPGPSQPAVELSTVKAGTVGGVAFKPSDIIAYDPAGGGWSMRFDASDVGIAKNLNAFYREDRDGAPDIYYLSFTANQPIAGLGTVTPWDVVKFTPSQLGDNTSGAFEWYFDGSDVGLSTAAEKIDAIGMDGSGRLLLSTTGAAKVPGASGNLSAADEDILAFAPTATGQNTVGAWSLTFDGSTVPGLAAKNVNGFWDDPAGDDLYLSIQGNFNIGGVKGKASDILRLTPSGGGYTVSLFWSGAANGFTYAIDGVELSN